MAASTSGAIKAYLETQGLGISVYRDQAPANTVRPYIVVTEAMTIIPDPLEDGAASTVREHVTVEVWMEWKNLSTVTVGGVVPGGLQESYTLPTATAKALIGCRLLTSGSGAPPTTVYGVLVHSVGPRILDLNDNLVHVPIWAEVWRKL